MMTHKEVKKGWTALASKVGSVMWNREILKIVTGLKGAHPKNMRTNNEVPTGHQCGGSSHTFSRKSP